MLLKACKDGFWLLAVARSAAVLVLPSHIKCCSVCPWG